MPTPSYHAPEGVHYCDRTGRWICLQCPPSREVTIAASSCNKLDCAMCFPKLKARRGARWLERFGAVAAGAYVFPTVLELRAVLGVDQAIDLRRMLGALLDGFYRDRWSVRTGSVIAFHPTGDTCEKCGWSKGSQCTVPDVDERTGRVSYRWHKGRYCSRCHWERGPLDDAEAIGVSGKCPACSAPAPWNPHFDVVVPLLGIRTDLMRVGASGELELEGRLKVLPPKLRPEDLADIKRRWSALQLELADARGIRLAPATRALLEAGNAVMHYTALTDERQKGHRFSYSARPFPAFANAIGALRTYVGFGLCGPNAVGAGVPEWRAKVRTEKVKRVLLCDCCDEPQELVIIDVVREHTFKWSFWRYARLHSSCGPPP